MKEIEALNKMLGVVLSYSPPRKKKKRAILVKNKKGAMKCKKL
jgi:hypothetical protein